MKIPSWLSTCSSAGASPSPPLLSHTNSNSSDHIHTQHSSSSTIHSLLTHPSLPSLSPDNAAPSATTTATATATATSIFFTSVKQINFLTLRDNLLYAASGNQIDVYNVKSKALIDTLRVRTSAGSVKSIAFLQGKVFTAHQDCKIRVWKMANIRDDEKKHKMVATLPTLEDRLSRIILPRNYVKVRRHKKKLSIQHYDAVSGLATCQNPSSSVLSISWDRSIKFWDPRSLRCWGSINKAHDDAINAVAVSNVDGFIYTGSADTRIKVWKKEGQNYRATAVLEKHKSAVNALALSLDGSILFSGSCDRSILVWEREDSANHMAVAGALRGHAKAVLCLMNVQDLLLSGSADGTVRIWQRRGEDGVGRYWCLSVLDAHQAPVRCLAVEDGGGGGLKIYSGSFDGEIKISQLAQN